METTGVPELEGLSDPFWRHHVSADAVRRVWRRGRAAVVEMERPMPGGVRVMAAAVGPPADLDPLLARAAAEAELPWRLIVQESSAPALPPAWRPAAPRSWHWMLTRTAPARRAVAPEVVELDVADPAVAAAIDDVLDEAMPETHARPGTAGIECWLGTPGPGRLDAVGALARQADGTGNLRGIAVRPAATGRGLGAAVSSALTRRALRGASGVATLGVYVDNPTAIRLYTRLGYEVGHTFFSGQLGDTA